MFRTSGKAVKILIVAAILFSAAGAVFARSGAEQVLDSAPDGLAAFVALSGCEEVKPAFDKSVLGRIWNDPGTQTFYSELKNEILGKIRQEINDPNAQKGIDITENLFREIFKRPVVIGFAEKKVEKGPPFYAFVIVDAGANKANISSALTNLESLADKGDIIEAEVAGLKMHMPKNSGAPLYWGWARNFLVFGFNDELGEAVKHLQSDDSRPVPNYLAKVPGSGDALVVYYDLRKILSLLEQFFKSEGQPDDFNEVKKVLSDLGVDTISKLVARVGFSGSNMVVDEFVEMQTPLRGLFGNFGTVDVSMFDMVDQRAMSAAAVNINFGGIYDTAMKAVQNAAGEDFKQIEESLAAFETQAGFKIRNGLLASLGGPFVSYTLAMGAIPELPFGGFVCVADLKDMALWENSMTGFMNFAAQQSNGMLQAAQQQQGDLAIHTYSIAPLMMMQMQPSWTVSGDRLVFASSPLLCVKAADQLNSKTGSIRETDGFKKIASKFPSKLMSLGYNDSKTQFNQTMMSLQQFWPMITMGATQQGLKLPFMLPSLGHIANDMGPSCAYSWQGTDGLYAHYEGTGIEQSIGCVGATAIVAGSMMPALARARGQAQMVVSASNLRQVGTCLVMYSNDHQGMFPEKLEDMKNYFIEPKILESPRKPKNIDGPSFIYITGQNASMSPENIIVYENPQFFCSNDRFNVLHLDGHVEAMKKDEFISELKATYNRLGREMHDVKFRN
ncbi:MAG: hypothetical protein E4H40_02605 [Candidatus Brocadiia bacterium]|nr:MAG: hypothetical protein E4H40_02605 [Candidatus Brocadiia bacterium]